MFRNKLYTITDDITENQSMKEHTTFKIGGFADYIVEPRGVEEIVNVIKLCREYSVPYFVMGNGSNLLVRDNGFHGVIIKLYRNFSKITVSGNEISVQSGALLSSVSAEAMRCGLCGLEFASGIPGTVGGAVFMNAGAYGGEMKDIVTNVTYIDDNLNIRSTGDCGFSYRHSVFQEKHAIITEVFMTLKSGNKDDIKKQMDELAAMRREKQPLTMPSAGSTFKRPKDGYAAQMIDMAGLRGFSFGNAQVSEKHTGFVVNLGGATANDVITLTDIIKEKVYNQFGVSLELEIKIIGD